MRIGLVGAGYMARQHAGALAGVPDAEIAAIAGGTPDSSRAARLAADLGLPGPTSLDSLLARTDIEAVVVTTPTATHRDVVVAALDAGKHVLCETPLAKTAEDAEGMAGHAATRGRHLQVALLARFADPGAWAHAQLREGVIGEPRAVRVARLAPGTSGEHHGDAIEEVLLFELDWILWTLGEPLEATASTVRGPTGRIDHVVAQLRYDNAIVTAEGSYLLAPGRPLLVQSHVIGTEGELEGRLEMPADGPPAVHLATYCAGAAPVVRSTLGPHPIAAEDARALAVFAGRAEPGLLHAREAAAALHLAEQIRRAAARA